LEPLDRLIAQCLFDGKPVIAGFIHESVNISVLFSEHSTQSLSPGDETAPIALMSLAFPAAKHNPTIDWSALYSPSKLPLISVVIIGLGHGVLTACPSP